MRFRKKISICKGVKLNLSKSGVSCTVGSRGMSLNLGKSGLFLNTSLPGTGLYNRRKLFDGKGFFQKKINPRDYQMTLDEGGDVVILDERGDAASDEEVKELRKTDWYDQQRESLMDQVREELESQTEAFVTIHENCPRACRSSVPQSAEIVEEKLNDLLEELELPMSFDVEYDYDEQTGDVMLDLDLPEIEEIPDDKAVQLASGAVRVKDKSQKELKADYRTCVFGLAVYFAGCVFSVSGGTKQVLISGFTQRRDRKTGELEDCYIYSIVFGRKAFENNSCRTEDPFEFCGQFRSRFNPLASGELKKIVPYSAEDLASEGE